MKLIIDIPEKVVTAIQNGEDYRYDIHTAIAQGIPYEDRPQGDLISREALKMAINYNQMYVNSKIAVDDVIKLIDNATTVDALPREYHDKVLDMTVAELQACQANLRPQGEWVKKQETPASVSYYCSNCKMSDLPVLPYCPWCGAKMKGGAE